MRILDKYIIREFLKVFGLCVMGFLLVFFLLDMTDRIEDYIRHNPSGWVMLQYFLVKIPGYLYFVIPLAILLGGMLSLLMMARHSEIIAIQANGIDALSIVRPLVLVGLVAGGTMFVLNESVIPWSNRYSEYILNVKVRKLPDRTFFKKDQIWMRSPGSITHINKFVKMSGTLEDITIIRWDENHDFEERLFADKAVWWDDDQHWMFYGVNRTERLPDGKFEVRTIPSMVGPLKRGPEDFGRVERLAKEMNLVELASYIENIKQEGQLPVRYLVDWHDKLAFPFMCLIMAVLSVPFAVKVNPRGGGVAIGLALSIVIAFGYWVVHTFFIALGHGGYIPPLAAAWASNVVFGLVATIMLLQAGT